jgi:hypothetical protein
MANLKQTRVIAVALATATPGIVASTAANASTEPPTQQVFSFKSDAAKAEALAVLKAQLGAMSPAEKGQLAVDRLPRPNLIILAAKNTAANCSNPCPKTKLLCPHKTTVPAGCPSTVTKAPKISAPG